MAKQSKASDSFGEISRHNPNNIRTKSPQRSVSPNYSYPNQPNHIKIHKDTSIHSIVKTNSSALLKKKSLKRIKATSPLLGKSPSSSIIQKNQKSVILDKKISLKSIENSLPDISSSNPTRNRSFTPHEKMEINTDLETSDILTKSKIKVLSFEKRVEKYEIYRRMFDEIIQKDKNFASVLKKIKDSYEEFYEFSIIEHTQKLKDKIENLTNSLNKKTEEVISLDKRIRKLSTENYDLAKSLERSEEICNRVQDRLNKISKFNMTDIPSDPQT